jgi:hypothetical protein
LIAKLLGQPESFMLGAETSEEAAFAVAAIRRAEPSVRELLESRTLIVRTDAAARFLAMKSNMVFIATGTAESLAGMLSRIAPRCPLQRAHRPGAAPCLNSRRLQAWCSASSIWVLIMGRATSWHIAVDAALLS